MVSNPFLAEGDPLRTQGAGTYQSVTGTKWRGEVAVVSNPFFLGGGEAVVSHLFLGEDDPLWSQGVGSYQSVTDTKMRGEGAVVSHPLFLFWGRGSQGVGNHDESPFPR